MAPSWIVNDSAGPAIFQPARSCPLKRLVNRGSAAGAATCKPAARTNGESHVMSLMGAQSTIDVLAPPSSPDRMSVRVSASAKTRSGVHLKSAVEIACFDAERHARWIDWNLGVIHGYQIPPDRLLPVFGCDEVEHRMAPWTIRSGQARDRRNDSSGDRLAER